MSESKEKTTRTVILTAFFSLLGVVVGGSMTFTGQMVLAHRQQEKDRINELQAAYRSLLDAVDLTVERKSLLSEVSGIREGITVDRYLDLLNRYQEAYLQVHTATRRVQAADTNQARKLLVNLLAITVFSNPDSKQLGTQEYRNSVSANHLRARTLFRKIYSSVIAELSPKPVDLLSIDSDFGNIYKMLDAAFKGNGVSPEISSLAMTETKKLANSAASDISSVPANRESAK